MAKDSTKPVGSSVVITGQPDVCRAVFGYPVFIEGKNSGRPCVMGALTQRLSNQKQQIYQHI